MCPFIQIMVCGFWMGIYLLLYQKKKKKTIPLILKTGGRIGAVDEWT
jgi:hypothetical protein